MEGRHQAHDGTCPRYWGLQERNNPPLARNNQTILDTKITTTKNIQQFPMSKKDSTVLVVSKRNQ